MIKLLQLFSNPESFWNYIKENPSILKKGWALVIALLLVLSGVIILSTYLRAKTMVGLVDWLPDVVSHFFVPIILIPILALAGHKLSKRYKNTEPLWQSFALVIYSIIPYLLITIIIYSFRDLYFFGLLGLYSFYIYFTGLQSMVIVVPEKRPAFILVIIMLAVLIRFFVAFILRVATVSIIM